MLAMRRIDAKDIYNYHKCKWRVYMDKSADSDKKDLVDQFVEMLWRGDGDHDKAIEYFQRQPERSFVTVGIPDDSSEESLRNAARQTILHMKNGEHFIYSGTLLREGEDSLFTQSPLMLAQPDLIIRVQGTSAFGEYTYIPVDIKSGKGLDENDWGERLTPGYLAQLSFYGMILEDSLKSPVKEGYVFNAHSAFVKYPLAYKTPAFQKILNEIRSMTEGDTNGREPVISSMCGICHWQSTCKRWADEHEDLTLLFYLGEKVKYSFHDIGIQNLHELAQTSENDLLSRVRAGKQKGLFYPRFNDELVKKLIIRAKLFLKEKNEGNGTTYIIYKKPDFPSTQKEIHYDIEDDTIRDFVYMHGFWIREKGTEPYYHTIVATRDKTEKEVSKELWEFFAENIGVPIYHYSSHEKHTCKKLMEKYNLDKEVFDRTFEERSGAIDLYDWIVAHTDWPLTSYGLKPLCKYTGFDWSAEDAGGANSVSWYARYLQGDDTMLEKIRTYNKEDCMATAHLKDWLVKNA